MQKFIIISCTIGSLAIILGQFGFFEGLLMFIVAGAIPGTPYSISPNIMYSLLITAISLVIIRLIGLAVFDFFYNLAEKYLLPTKKKQRKQLPKRRYSQI